MARAIHRTHPSGQRLRRYAFWYPACAAKTPVGVSIHRAAVGKQKGPALGGAFCWLVEAGAASFMAHGVPCCVAYPSAMRSLAIDAVSRRVIWC